MKRILTAALAFVLFAGAAQAQNLKDSARHHGDHEMMMKQLNLSADQKAKFKALHQSEKNEMQELHKKYHDQMQSILSPAQKEQFEKMKAEHHGHKHGMKGSRRDKAMAFKQLDLNQGQKDQLTKLREQSRNQFESIRKDQALTKTEKKTKAQELRKQNFDQIKTIITADQLQKMKELRKERKPRDAK